MARIKRDIINLRSDFLSILISVNNAGYDFENDVVDNGIYKLYFRLFLEQIKEELPNKKLLIMKPYILYRISEKMYLTE